MVYTHIQCIARYCVMHWQVAIEERRLQPVHGHNNNGHVPLWTIPETTTGACISAHLQVYVTSLAHETRSYCITQLPYCQLKQNHSIVYVVCSPDVLHVLLLPSPYYLKVRDDIGDPLETVGQIVCIEPCAAF